MPARMLTKNTAISYIRCIHNAMRNYYIFTIPKKLVEAMKLKAGENLRIYTDGDKLYIDRFEEPTL
jgi:bifunctional DNA-binding transcriptional regulator/antitoxin component of YhaV-PrlF toxin-antitoxin module